MTALEKASHIDIPYAGATSDGVPSHMHDVLGCARVRDQAYRETCRWVVTVRLPRNFGQFGALEARM